MYGVAAAHRSRSVLRVKSPARRREQSGTHATPRAHVCMHSHATRVEGMGYAGRLMSARNVCTIYRNVCCAACAPKCCSTKRQGLQPSVFIRRSTLNVDQSNKRRRDAPGPEKPNTHSTQILTCTAYTNHVRSGRSQSK